MPSELAGLLFIRLMSKGYTPFYGVHTTCDDFEFTVSLSGPSLRTALCSRARAKTRQPARFIGENIYRQIVQSNLKCLIRSDMTELLFYPKIPVVSLVASVLKVVNGAAVRCEHVIRPAFFLVKILCFSALSSHYYNFHLNSRCLIAEAMKVCAEQSNIVMPSEIINEELYSTQSQQ